MDNSLLSLVDWGSDKIILELISKASLLCLCHMFCLYRSGPGCSKLTTSLKFQTLISRICQYFLLKKCEKLLHQQKISV